MTWTASQAPFGRLRIGGEATRGEMVEPDAVLQVANGVLDLGVAAMVGLQRQGISIPVGDESVIAVVGEQRQLGTGRGLDPAYDEPHGCGVGLALEGYIRGLRHVGGALHPIGDGRPVPLGYGLDDVAQTGVLSGGDGAADVLIAADGIAADGDDGVGVEAAVGPHRELTRGTGVAHPAHRLPQEVVGAPSGDGAALAQPCHQHVAGSGGHGQDRVIAPLAGVVVALRTLLAQPKGLADGGVQVDGGVRRRVRHQ